MTELEAIELELINRELEQRGSPSQELFKVDFKEHPFKSAIDVASRPGYAVKAGIQELQKPMFEPRQTNVIGEMLSGLRGEKRVSANEIWKNAGVEGIPGMGFASEILFDPISYVNPSKIVPPSVMQGLTKTGKTISKAGDLLPIVKFPYKSTLKIKSKLSGYFRNLNTKYGDELDKIVDEIGGTVKGEDVAGAMRARLQEVGLLDSAGNPIQIVGLNSSEKKIMNLYEELATNPQEIDLKTLIKAKQDITKGIRLSVKQGNVPINSEERFISGINYDIGKAIAGGSERLQELNRWYAKERSFFDSANTRFKVFKNDFETRTGENFLSNYNKVSEGDKLLLQDIETKLEIPNLTSDATVYSSLGQMANIMGSNIRGAVAGAGKGATTGIGRMESSIPRTYRTALGRSFFGLDEEDSR